MLKRIWFAVFLVTLLTSTGAKAIIFEPIGSPQAQLYQKWANEANIATYPGQVNVALATLCSVGIEGCSAGPLEGYSNWTVYADSRDTLYFELGHIFDWAMLKGYQRRLMSIRWDSAGWHWTDTERGLEVGAQQGVGVEDGLEGLFAMVYQDCAWGHSTVDTSYVESIPDSIKVTMPSIYTGNFNTCAYIRRIGRAHDVR